MWLIVKVLTKQTYSENLVSLYDPDFFVGTESWLSSKITNNESFPPGYIIYGRDSPDGYREVFFDCLSGCRYTCINIQTTCEIVPCKE